MKTAIAISPMMRNVLSAAAIPPATVTASHMTKIAPRIVPMIRPMAPVCARGLRQATAVPAAPGRSPGPCGPTGCLAGTAPGHRWSEPGRRQARDDRGPARGLRGRSGRDRQLPGRSLYATSRPLMRCGSGPTPQVCNLPPRPASPAHAPSPQSAPAIAAAQALRAQLPGHDHQLPAHRRIQPPLRDS
jgi:hypothetical protein